MDEEAQRAFRAGAAAALALVGENKRLRAENRALRRLLMSRDLDVYRYVSEESIDAAVAVVLTPVTQHSGT